MYEFENSGKNVEKTIEDGLKKLGLSKGTVDIKVLETGGFFKKAKVLFLIPDDVYSESEEVQKQVKLFNLEKKVILESQQQAQEKEQTKKLKLAKNNKNKTTLTATENKNTNDNLNEKIDLKKINNSEKTSKKSISKLDNVNKIAETENLSTTKQNINNVNQVQTNVELEKGEISKKESASKSQNEIINTQINLANQLDMCINFLKEFLKIAKIDASVDGYETDEIFLNIEGEKLYSLIGFRGQALNALQLILSAISSKLKTNKKVRLDIGGYRRKRKLSLESLAERMAKRVIETQERVYLQPMTAYERRIVHNAIQKYPELESHSTGEEPHRILTITIKSD